jgi:2-polyprenyl-6-methoxyphenol hydroxylase-like FAD-dependent oxidoreductase
VHVAVVGAGPAGLLFALLAKRRRAHWRIEVIEQNAPDATIGLGGVFSQGARELLARDAPDLHAALVARMETWPVQRIVHRDIAVDVDGNGFSAIGRLELLRFLQALCREAGVELRFGERLAAMPEADLVLGADGLNSTVREADGFAPRIEWLGNRFAWFGTRQRFECLTLTFREAAAGGFVAHHYRYAPDMSTFIVECDEATWRRAGLDGMDEARSAEYCARVFAPDLGGHALQSNKSLWRRFPLLSNPVWSAGNRVLIGDALRSMHFSIGSGTRLAFEDAIALDRALGEAGEDVPAALAAFERERRPVVEKLFAAASASSFWYEDFPARMQRFDALGLAYDYMTRSGRMSPERLRRSSPGFMQQIDASGLSA